MKHFVIIFYGNIYLAVFLLIFVACEAIETPAKTAKQTRATYLALGDSYTIGERVAEEDRYPIQLAQQLNRDRIALDTTIIIAKTGWTTDELQVAIDEQNLEDTFDLVSLLIGVNNQYRGYSIDIYRKEFEALLKQAIEFAGGKRERVFVISIPDYAYTPFGQTRDAATISKGIDQYNAINDSIANAYNISYFNITDLSRNGLEQPSLVAEDELHPSEEQYQLWVASFYDTVKKKIEYN